MAGVVIYDLLTGKGRAGSIDDYFKVFKKWKEFLPYLVFPNLPDIDFLIGAILYHDPRLLHYGVTHTLGFAALFSLLMVPFRLFGGPLKTGVTTFFLVGSHLFLDMSSGHPFSRIEPVGVMLFYPFSEERFVSPLPFLFGVRHGTVGDLLSIHNFLAVGWEVSVFVFLTALRRLSVHRARR